MLRFPTLQSLIIATVFLCLFGSACQKTRTCSLKIVKVPGLACFVGFSSLELDTLFVNTYTSNSNFTQLNKQDTLYPTQINLKHDTAYLANTGFFNLSGNDMEIIVPAAQRSYRISELIYHCDSVYTYTTEQQSCPTRGTPLCPPDSVSINGKPVLMTLSSGASTLVFLHK